MSSPQFPGSSYAEPVAANEDGDGEIDWEEITVPVTSATAKTGPLDGYTGDNPIQPQSMQTLAEKGNIEITIQRSNKVDPKRKKQAEQNAELRAVRLACHKMHTVALLSNALARNKWINDPLLHARLLSLTPLPLQISFLMITKKSHPDAAMRGRLFESSLMRLTEWWYESYHIEDKGHIRSRTFDEVQKILFSIDFDDDEGEVVKNSKSLMKHAVNRWGSRDVSAQLFTALCRALGIPARLVVSIQSVPWKAGVGKPKVSGKKSYRKGKEKTTILSSASSTDDDDDDMKRSDGDADDVDADDDDMEEISIPPLADVKGKGKMQFPGEGQVLSGVSTPSLKGKEKAQPRPVVKLRKSRPVGQRLGSGSRSRQSTPATPIGGYPPVFWTEVFSRPDGKWMPADPIRCIVNKRKLFEPPSHDRNNRMVYVVAVEEDGYCRDVTPRYAKEYGTKTTKSQLAGKGRKEWWEGVMSLVTRPYRLLRDDVEDEEFEFNKYTEGMPTSVIGFKDHPLYVLEQHLKREEVIFPKTEVGKFRGESVYPRSNVVPLKTAENWMRMGRRVKEGAQAMKWVKQRAVTIHRRRAMELAQQDGDEVLQGLYSEAQTELYIPEPVIDGIIPKNDFGNIDLYTPSMLPAGAAHVAYKGTAKIARKLGFDHAEAVTSFEFKKGRAFPVISGIVVAAENEEALLEAYWEAEREAEEKELKKQKERVIKRWSMLIQGLRIRQRLLEQYADNDQPSASTLPHNEGDAADTEQPGGFLTDADAIVQPFHLPRFEHGTYEPSSNEVEMTGRSRTTSELTVHDQADQSGRTSPSASSNDLEDVLGVDYGEMLTTTDRKSGMPAEDGAPKTMRELAEEVLTGKSQKNSPGLSGNAAQKPRPVISADAAVHPPLPGKQSPTPAVKMARRGNGIPTKATKRPRSTRKREVLSSQSEDDMSGMDGDSIEDSQWGEDAGDGGDNKASSRKQRSNTIRPILKRKRPVSGPATPAPATRVLRTRVPKSVEKLKAEKEAEIAFRKAIAE
ncbi:hypothetical protein M0805_005912 [Coniferiporia weirii]|nr:hypothetical protein M0805_005912 [Coniferiporia weirii]